MMFDGHEKAAWNHTASLYAAICNIFVDPKKDTPVQPGDIHPYFKKPARESPKIKLKELKGALLAMKPERPGK